VGRLFTANLQNEAAMMAPLQYRSDLQKPYGTLHYHNPPYAELRVLCLWSVVGLTLFAMELGTEIGQALIVAG
jgi:hypothetical protein